MGYACRIYHFSNPSAWFVALPYIRICPSNTACQKSSVIRPGKTINSDNPSAESIPHGFSVLTRTNSRPVASWNLSNTSHGIFPVVGCSLSASNISSVKMGTLSLRDVVAARGIDQFTFHPTGKTVVNKANDLNRDVVHDCYMELQAVTRPQPL